MPIGSYSVCPGGTGKKVKFCCPDLAAELQKIERMIEGEQHLACLKLIERLQQDHSDRACLWAAKILLLRKLGQIEEAVAAATIFFQKHSENPIALAEATISAATTEGGRAGMEMLSRAITTAGGKLSGRLYEAIGVIGRVLIVEGQFLSARRVFLLQTALRPDDPAPKQMLVQMSRAPNIPLLVKDDRPLDTCPEGAPWKAAFDEAISLAGQAQWAKAAEKFEWLAHEAGDEPAVWWNLATVRGWLADIPGCVDALKRYASLDLPLEDAVEAEALCLLLMDNPLGDHLDMLTLTYPVDDIDALQAAFSQAPEAGQVRTDLAALAEDDGPPPKAVFFLFDRTAADSAPPTSIESVPRVLCQALLFGRQTDRQARLEVMGVVSRDLEEVKALLARLAAELLTAQPEEEVIDEISATQEMLTRNWRLPEGSSRQAFQQLISRYVEQTLLEVWPLFPLGLFDGASPKEAAGNEAQRVTLLAAIMVVEFWLEQAGAPFDCNRLRSRLGLPTLEPIDPQQTPIDGVPLSRLARVAVEKLSDDELLAAYRRAIGFGAREASATFSRAIVGRPSMAGREEQLHAFALLSRLAESSDEALEHIDQGRRAAEAAGKSSASWDLMELSCRFERGEGLEVSRLINHLQSSHFQEPGVAEALADMLVQAGLLRPDGTPAAPVGTAAEHTTSIVVPGAAGAEPGKLWTPDSQKPAGEKPKIWTPGSG